MSGIQQLLLGGSPAGYQIERSLRFNSADSAYLNRTPASAGNRTTWTYSFWVKRSALSSNQFLVSVLQAGAADDNIGFLSDDTFRFRVYDGGATIYGLTTTQVFRDVSSWYHILCVYNSTSATSSNRMQLYVNGTQVTAFGTATYPTQNLQSTGINNTYAHNLGRYGNGTNYFNGLITEVNFIDGQALTPSSFGQTNSATGVWEPKKYTGTYGTNGFYLNFSDNSNTTAATLGKDSSGNGNNWTPNNFSVTAGAGNDSLVDTPTSYGSDTGVGGEVRGNYATLNPLDQSSVTVSNGNLSQTTASGRIRGTFFLSSGKWYCEVTFSAIPSTTSVGIANTSYKINTSNDTQSRGYLSTGSKITNGTSSAYGASYTSGDVIGVAFDIDAGTITFYKNNVSQGVAFTDIANDSWSLWIQGGYTGDVNFGQRPFAYTAPSGFKALCTQNLPTPTIGATSTTQANDYFDVSLYTGNGSTQSITNSGSMQPDFVWLKGRSVGYDHFLYDAVRGTLINLSSNLTSAEQTVANSLTSFNSNGFSLGGGTSSINANGTTYVGWQWNAGGSNATNTSGTITSTVRANTTAGFSIVTYTASGSTFTVGHGLGVAPSMVLHKQRNNGVNDWLVYHTSLGTNSYLRLNTTAASSTLSGLWTTSSTTFGCNSAGANPTLSGDHVFYCFAAVAGYSAFGSYTGNGSADSPFIYMGFRPRYVMIKRATGGVANWELFDSARDPYNQMGNQLYANSSSAEYVDNNKIDFLSNGIKIRSTQVDLNNNGDTYIYAAFAETAFKWALGR